MKKIIFTLIVLLPLFAGCKKGHFADSATVSGDRMTFSADLSLARSHFGDASSPQLYWDLTDKIAVYSKPACDVWFSAGHFLGSISEAVAVNEITGSGVTARFESERAKLTWFPAPGPFDPEEDIKEEDLPFIEELYNMWHDYYVFYAYYPCAGEPGAVTAIEIENPGHPDDPYRYQYIPLSVPATQDGVSYSDYQILHDPGEPETDGDPSDYLIDKTDVILNNASVSFSNFKPVTAMLRFTLQLPAGSEAKTLTDLTISIEGDADNNSIAGNAMLMLWQYGAKDSLPICMEKSNNIPYLWAAAPGTNAITISGSREITTTPSSYLYAVMIPLAIENDAAQLKISAKDSEDKEYSAKRVLPLCYEGEHDDDPDFYGFREGHRYNAAITLYASSDPRAENAGYYIEDEW